MKELIAQYSPDIIKSLIELLVIYLIVRYGPSKVKELKLSEDEVDAIVYDFDPEEIVVSNYEDTLVYEEVKYELADYDIFEIKNDHKEKLNKILIDYGVGACGPRGFYGTLDLHLKLENELAKVYERDSSVLYSNSYTCINSVISCFCKTNDVIFFYKNCSPGILRGISLTKSKSVEFISLLDLKDKIRTNLAPQKNNYLILEGVCELTGEILDLKEYLKLKYDHKIRIILDESNSFPVLGKQGIFTYQNVLTKEVDIIIGSFSNYLCSNGGFVVSDYNIADFQRLSSSSYCFSASLPGVLTEFNYSNLQRSFDFTKLAEKNAFFVERFHNHFLKINSLPDSFFVLISLVEENESRIKQIKIIKFIKDELLKKGVRVGMVEYPIPCLKINIKIRYEEEDLIDCLDILGKIDLPLLSDSEEEIDF